MCGIAGWIATTAACPAPDVLQAMTDAIVHRGPDGEGHFRATTGDGGHTVALGMRRLAIIDLNTGDQPIHANNGRATIVFNGEIYNYRELRAELEAAGRRFATASDTEVVLQAYLTWGTASLNRLRGMFGLAIWDADAETLLLARDRFGKKPIFLYEADGLLLFGSEIKSLLACPGVAPALDRESVLDYLCYRYVPGPHTMFRGIRKLAPGSFALWRKGRLQEESYYTPPDASAAPDAEQPGNPVAAFLDKLDEAVRVRMVSDVPFGAFLSGGVDSSAIVGLMSRHSTLPINTFSVGFSEEGYSELPYARMAADRFRTNHTELIISAAAMMDRLPQLIAYSDAPVAEPANIPIYLLACEARKTVKMVLVGEGSDEVLAGYPKHVVEPFVGPYQAAVPEPLHRGLVEPLMRLLPYRFRRVKTLVANLSLRDPMERMARWHGALSYGERDALSNLAVAPRQPDQRPFATAAGQSPLRRVLYFDQTSWLPDNLLERGDRMTMAASIEARVPFLDHELVAFMARLPDHCRIRWFKQKYILRQAMQDILPREILERPKVGFRTPVNDWFQGEMRDFVRDHLGGPDSMTRAFYRPEMLDRLLQEHLSGAQNHEKLIWTLINLELFQRHYRLS